MTAPKPSRKFVKILLTIMGLAVVLTAQPAEAKKAHRTAHHRRHHGHAVVDKHASYADIVIDAETGQILHATAPDELRHPASLTKMMTLYLTFAALESGQLGLNQYLPISVNAAEQPPSKLGLRPGQRIRVEDAILGLVTESANDAAVVMGEWLGGDEKNFANMMTRQAQALGMTRTRFDNPSGLPDQDQVTTARDMAILGHSLIYHFPQYYAYFSRDNFTYAGVAHANHNHLMERYDGMDGIKTGYIRASGFNLVASVKRGDTRLIGVVFGGHSATARDNRMALLLDQSFAQVRQDKAAPRVASAAPDAGEGDSNDNDSANNGSPSLEYVSLPSKGAVNLPSRDGAKGGVSTGGNWGIQIGAFSDPIAGRQALAAIAASMPQVLGAAEPQVQKVSANAGIVVYRARLMSLDEKTATAACTWLTKHGRNCLTVGPDE